MEVLRPDDAHRLLLALSGHWEEPDGASPRGTYVGRMTLDGLYLVLDYAERRREGGHYSAHAVIGWDPETHAYRMDWFDLMPGQHGAALCGVVTPDGALTFDARGPFGRALYALRVDDDGAFVFRIDVAPDGRTFSTVQERRYRRHGPVSGPPVVVPS